ncbi:hypothetical protein HPP92_026910 [Vanilla planifolia]|uniref:Pentatricopeptide repeat-containing protein n=1 Tax=Vanilla planifolia TaxID=51239 RepID=A0A835U8K4_VANPL|nr:hypothetical protein HPP92_026910 [Vanilla planifolia]
MARSSPIFQVVASNLSLSNSSFFSFLLHSCIKSKSLHDARRIHARILKTQFVSKVFIQNKLIEAYAKCGSLVDAQKLFDQMLHRNTFTWNNLIGALLGSEKVEEAEWFFRSMPMTDQCSWNLMVSGLAQHGWLKDSLKYFNRMHSENFVLNGYCFSSALSACAGLIDMKVGIQIHALVWKSPFAYDVYMGSSLVDMYSKCRRPSDAVRVFEGIPERNVVSWNCLITCFEQNGPVSEALVLFRRMLAYGVEYDEVTLASIVSACASLELIREGVQLHAQAIKSEYYSKDLIFCNALVDMYAKCNKVNTARKIFDRLLVKSMVSVTTMLTGYAKALKVDDARLMFMKMLEKNIVAWNALIAGYTRNGENEESLRLFVRLKKEGIWPSHYTFGNILNACANLADLLLGQQVHAHVLKHGFQFQDGLEPDIFVGNALLDMYHKCGIIDEAGKVFERMAKDRVSWNAMIVGYAQNGRGEEAISLYKRMLLIETPDHVTMIGVLSGCSHAGLVEEGSKYLLSMCEDHGLILSRDHYTCIIDLLGRAGQFDYLEKFIQEMPIVPDSVIWSSLLSTCRLHDNIELGERVAQRLLELDKENSGPYILLSNMYAKMGRWTDAVGVRKLMKQRQVVKKPGCSWIEIRAKVHVFMVKDKSHPMRKEIFRILRFLQMHMARIGSNFAMEISSNTLCN